MATDPSALAERIRTLRRLLTQWRRWERMANAPTNPAELQRLRNRLRNILDQVRAWDWQSLWAAVEHPLDRFDTELPQRWEQWRVHWIARLRTALGADADLLQIRGTTVTWRMLRLEPHLEHDRVHILYGPDRLDTRPADPMRLARWLQQWYRDLTRRARTPERFVPILVRAYRRAQTAGGHTSPVPIMAVYRELVLLHQSNAFWTDARTRTFRAYPRYLFSYELALLRRTAATAAYRVRLITAPFATTRRRADHIWVPDGDTPEGTRYAWIEITAEHL